MIHIFKNLNFGGLLALVAGVVLMVSWTKIEKPAQKTNTATYKVELQNNVLTVTDEPSEATCSEPTGDICAIELTFDDAEVSLPMSLDEVESHTEIEIGDRWYRL